MGITVIISFKVLFLIFLSMHFCSKITSPDNITRVHLWSCEFSLIREDFTEQSKCRIYIGEIRKESNILTFFVHNATFTPDYNNEYVKLDITEASNIPF